MKSLSPFGVNPLQPYVKVLQLVFPHRRGRLGHQADRLLRLGKGDHLTDRIRAGQEHGEAIQPKGDPPMRRRPVFQRLEEKTEFLPCLALPDPQSFKDPALDLSSVNSNASPADL